MVESSEAAEKRYLYSAIVDQIQEMIRRGELKVGDKLPPERTLAQTLNVSRNCVRQAIQTLAERNILESRRGDGTYVCAPDQSRLISSFALAIQVQKELLHDIMEFRMLLEPQIAGLAAKHISREELDRLKIIVCDQERRILAGEDDTDLDAAFHLLLAQAARNKIIKDVASSFSGIVNESRAETFRSEARIRASVVAHLRIIDALEKGDAEMAAQAMREHLLQVEELVLKCQRKESTAGEV